MIVFIDRTQFLIFPALGFVRSAGELCFTIAFLWFGISFRICRINEND